MQRNRLVSMKTSCLALVRGHVESVKQDPNG